MAHELWVETASGTASMFYVNEVPWHGLGKRLTEPATSAEAIKAANLDWEVTKRLLYVQKEEKHVPINDRFAIMRPAQGEEEGDVVLGVVGKEYTPLQNVEAFAFFDHIVGKNAAIYHTAGALGQGERVWILAKLPETIRVVGDDITDKYLLLANSHDGSSAVQIKFTPIRVVCNNTLTVALSQGDSIRIPHTKDVRIMLKQAEHALGFINQSYNDISQVFKAMASQKLTIERVREYLTKVFPAPRNLYDEYEYKRALNNRDLAEMLFDQGVGNKMQGVEGTLWAAYNGVTELIDHRQLKQTEDKRLNSIWFGNGHLTKTRAFRVANEFLKAV
ncbi:MAG: DUF932 domain-containing protein [Desulfuromonadaceae bacterium]|nr:DUF932 domain-containing protein [Desulfuromonadaceae bacterium]